MSSDLKDQNLLKKKLYAFILKCTSIQKSFILTWLEIKNCILLFSAFWNKSVLFFYITYMLYFISIYGYWNVRNKIFKGIHCQLCQYGIHWSQCKHCEKFVFSKFCILWWIIKINIYIGIIKSNNKNKLAFFSASHRKCGIPPWI